MLVFGYSTSSNLYHTALYELTATLPTCMIAKTIDLN